uniref:Uncharacterized protein n=1 Tax=Solanum lycopersicum TaxID=4081 RepID=A0A3Q7I3F7_SOLLC
MVYRMTLRTLQLVGRMRSSRHPLMNDLNSLIHDLCNCNDNTYINVNVTRKTLLPNPVTVYRLFAEFCKILRGAAAAGVEDALYILCGSSLA